MRILPLWESWQMMNRLRCTYTQLQQEPQEEIAIFFAFAEGEASAEKAIRENQQNSK